jgi:hypothetical protein
MITTESPLKNIFDTNRSFDTDFIFFPLLFLMDSVHNSLTFSNIKLQCLSNAFTLPTNLWLLRHETTTGVLLFMAFWINDIGPWVNSNSSNFWSSSSVSSDLGRSINSLKVSKQFGYGVGSLHTSYCLCSVGDVVREFVYHLNLG